MTDLAVAYRVYPGISKSPAFFSTDKFRLTDMCLRSFRSGLGGLKIKIWALLDACPPEYEELFRDVLSGQDLEVIKLDKLGNQGTFSLQIDLLLRQSDAEFVYFAEDDYFYLPSALEKMVGFMRANPDVDFVTPYDHPDSYFTSSRHERHLVRPWGDRYWRTASSTCLTFLTSRTIVQRTERMLRTYSRGSMDHPMWLALTQKLSLLNAQVHCSDLSRTKLWVRMWQYGLRQVLFGRRYRLWAPMPALSTHMESTCLSPLIDWPQEFEHFDRISGKAP